MKALAHNCIPLALIAAAATAACAGSEGSAFLFIVAMALYLINRS